MAQLRREQAIEQRKKARGSLGRYKSVVSGPSSQVGVRLGSPLSPHQGWAQGFFAGRDGSRERIVYRVRVEAERP